MKRIGPRMAVMSIVALTGTAAASAQDDPWLSSEVAAPTMKPRLLERHGQKTAGDPRVQGRVASASGMPGWLRTGLSLAGVVGLIVVLALTSRKLHLVQRGRRPGLIEVISRTPLSPRQSLALVRVGPRTVLIGVTNDRISQLDVITDPELTARLAGAARQHRPDSHTVEFHERLEQEGRRYDEDDDQPVVPEYASTSPTRMLSLKRQLAGTLRRLGAVWGKRAV